MTIIDQLLPENLPPRELQEKEKVDKTTEIYRQSLSLNLDENSPADRLEALCQRHIQIKDEIKVLEKVIYFFENVVCLDQDKLSVLNQFRQGLERARIIKKGLELAILTCP